LEKIPLRVITKTNLLIIKAFLGFVRRRSGSDTGQTFADPLSGDHEANGQAAR
jgi:hypothetical protein